MDFRLVAPMEFMKYSNANTTIICEIETIEGLKNVEDIAAVDGIDALFLGAFDLCQALEIPFSTPVCFDHPKLLAAIDTILDAGRKFNKPVMAQPRTLAQAKDWVRRGFGAISFSADAWIYRDALAIGAEEIRKYSLHREEA